MTMAAALPLPCRARPAAGRDWTTLLSSAAVSGAAALAAAAALQPWVEPRLLFMDVIAAAQAAGYCCKVYWGFLSNLGVVVWCLTAAVGLFSGLTLWATGRASRTAVALGLAGALSLVIALDDLLMLHESVLPGFGMSQTVLLLFYATLGGGYALVQWRTLLPPEGAFLLLAFAFFGLSLGTDVLVHSIDTRVVAVEDGLKFVGIVSWAVFHFRLAGRTFSALLNRTGRSDAG